MANYISTWRSNYFKVKDREAFLEFISRVHDLDVKEDERGFVLLEAQDGEGGAPSMISLNPDDDDAEPAYFDTGEAASFESYIAAHLADGEVAILMESGHEKLRYVSGYATAVRADGEIIHISLSMIYDLVEREWGVKTTEATY